MKRRTLPWLAALVLLPCAWSAPVDPFAHPVLDEAALRSLLARPATKLRNAQVLTGKFRHSRHLSEIPKPLVAQGDFTFVRDLGVHWHTRLPFDSVVVLTAEGLAQSDDGGPVQRVSASQQPAVGLITNIFMALFTLDTRNLDRDFILSGAEDENGRWILGLKPRSAALAGVFSAATVAGSGDVEQVVLTDSRGDRTVIDLTAITYSSDPPGADARALFALLRP